MVSVERALRSQYIPHPPSAAAGRVLRGPPRTNTERGLTADLGDPAWHSPGKATDRKGRKEGKRPAAISVRPAGIKALLNVSAIFSKARS